MLSPAISLRNLRFDRIRDAPRYWMSGRRAVTLFMDNLSLLFPEGEKFFILSVKACEDRIRDPRLAEDVKGFYGQEAVHRREHERYNQRLRDFGLPVDEIEGQVRTLLERAHRTLSPVQQLAVTAALEHFTAMLAHVLLAETEGESGEPLGDRRMLELWRWHAAEEHEHRSVAFDVFHAIGGRYLTRCHIMLTATAIFWLRILQQQIRLMRAEGIALSAREWSDLLRFLFADPGPLRRLLRPYLSYFRPGFHPSTAGGDELFEAWRRDFERGDYAGAMAG